MSISKVRLEDCCISISDGDHLPPPKTEKGIPFITISNINSYNQIDFTNTMFVPENYYNNLDTKRKPQQGDILYSVVGSFGIPVLIKDSQKFVFQRHIAILRPNKSVDSRWLYYKMLSKDFYALADVVAIGAAQRTISLSALRNMEITLPDVDTQHRIADILSKYDDLIENNQKQIKLLEGAAQRLYKEWFVDLRFPGYESTTITDGVPEGWNKSPIGDLIDKSYRSKQVKTADYMIEGDIPVVDQSRAFVAGYTNDIETVVDLGKPVIVFGDHTRILKYIQFPFAKGADGTQLIVSNCEKMPQVLLYFSLLNVDLSNYHYARHFKYLKAEEIIVPDKTAAEKYDAFATTIMKKVHILRKQIQNAEQARDRLLPKLMSGEIEV